VKARKKPDWFPENAFNSSPNAEITWQIKYKKRAKKENPAKAEVKGRSRLKPEVSPTFKERLHPAFHLLIEPIISKISSRRSGWLILRACGSSFQ
jgi:hypothetical protein